MPAPDSGCRLAEEGIFAGERAYLYEAPRAAPFHLEAILVLHATWHVCTRTARLIVVDPRFIAMAVPLWQLDDALRRRAVGDERRALRTTAWLRLWYL